MVVKEEEEEEWRAEWRVLLASLARVGGGAEGSRKLECQAA